MSGSLWRKTANPIGDTGIENQRKWSRFSVYPNSDFSLISFEESVLENVEILVFSKIGENWQKMLGIKKNNVGIGERTKAGS